ncbi:MAG: winged helix DNA-binding domain-containing protein [Bacteroidota bacterium]
MQRLGAVQAQDYAAAKWALGLRMKKATDADIEQAFNDGKILRTHVMRPTWHFVLPEDIRWMQELTAPRVKTLLAHYDWKLEIDRKLLLRAQSIIAKTLSDHNYQTREEIAQHLESKKIAARGQRLAHIVMHAELHALICSGPRRGKQFTYALLEERAPRPKKLSRDEALATLASKYFTSHGPAQLKDFAWWSGLSVKDATGAIQSIRPKIITEAIDGKTYFLSPDTKPARLRSPQAHLLSIYDEYTIAYKDYSSHGGETVHEKLRSMGNALTSVLVLDGKIAGTWKRVVNKGTVKIATNPFRRLSKAEYEAVKAAAVRYGAFLEMPSVLSYGRHSNR